MATQSSRRTIDHEEIRKWAEARGGHPATVKRTVTSEKPGILRIDFPGYRGEEDLGEISWDEFFDQFEDSDLTFIYQETTAEGQTSRFCKLVRRTEDDRRAYERSRRKAA